MKERIQINYCYDCGEGILGEHFETCKTCGVVVCKDCFPMSVAHPHKMKADEGNEWMRQRIPPKRNIR